jgi:predicted dehydrogenase
MLQECLKDCEKLKNAIESNGVTFCYAENWVYARPVWKAKNLLKSAKGKILEIRCGESHSGSHSPFAAEWRFTGGGALIRMGAHPYGAAIHLKMWEGLQRDGKPIYPESVIATTARYRDFLDQLPRDQDRVKSRPIDVEDWSTGIITFEDGTNATVIASDTTLGGIEAHDRSVDMHTTVIIGGSESRIWRSGEDVKGIITPRGYHRKYIY